MNGLPDILYRAIKNDTYSKGASDYSVTELLKPARAVALEKAHVDEIEEDVSARVWSLFGQAVHSIIERGANENDLVEERFFASFDGVKVSGQIDLLSEGILSDWKVTKAYAFSTKGGSGLKPDWVSQLNMQLELLRMNGLDAERLQIIGILKDFSSRCLDPSDRNFMAGYPRSEVVVVDIPMWPRDKTKALLKARIDAHKQATSVLPECSASETWAGRRCAQWCSVKPFCTQYQTALKTGRLT